jgi:hypothetical protein
MTSSIESQIAPTRPSHPRLFEFSDIREAHRLMESSGKIVVRVWAVPER